MAPEHAFAHLQMGIVQIFTNRATRGVAECERAWRSIEIWPSLTALSASPNISSVTARKPRLMSKRRSVLVLATLWPTFGWGPRATREFIWATTRRRLHGCDGPSTLTEAFRYIISFSPPPSGSSAGWTKRGPWFRQGWRSIRPSPFHAFAPARRATTPPFLPSARDFTRACARPGSPKNDRGPSARRDPRRRARSPGIDPERAFEIGPMNGRIADKADVGSRQHPFHAGQFREFSKFARTPIASAIRRMSSPSSLRFGPRITMPQLET